MNTMSPKQERIENTILNFSLKGSSLKELPDSISKAEVGIDMTAEEAARVAEERDDEVLVVKDHGDVVGYFFPKYLKEVLPTHRLVVGSVKRSLSSSTPLHEMISIIDDAGIDFHSESVNISPSVWFCRGGGGHISYIDPCPRHNLPCQRF